MIMRNVLIGTASALVMSSAFAGELTFKQAASGTPDSIFHFEQPSIVVNASKRPEPPLPLPAPQVRVVKEALPGSSPAAPSPLEQPKVSGRVTTNATQAQDAKPVDVKSKGEVAKPRPSANDTGAVQIDAMKPIEPEQRSLIAVHQAEEPAGSADVEGTPASSDQATASGWKEADNKPQAEPEGLQPTMPPSPIAGTDSDTSHLPWWITGMAVGVVALVAGTMAVRRRRQKRQSPIMAPVKENQQELPEMEEGDLPPRPAHEDLDRRSAAATVVPAESVSAALVESSGEPAWLERKHRQRIVALARPQGGTVPIVGAAA